MMTTAARFAGLAVVAFAGFGLAPAVAQGRPQSVAMTCAQTAALVQSRGALILGTGGQTYDRYVRDRGFCEITQTTKSRFVPTRDNPSCFVGYTCREPSRDDWEDD